MAVALQNKRKWQSKVEVYIINVVLLTLVGLAVEKFSKSRKLLKVYCVYCFIQMTLLAAFRLDIGIDYSQYYHAFYGISKSADWNEVFQFRYEVGYLIINRLISYVTNNIIVFMGIYHGIMYGLLMFYIYRYSEEKWLSVLAFVVLDYYAMSFCFIRQGMSVVIGLYAIEQMRKRKWYFACPLVLLSSSFHASALILLFYYVLSYINWKKRWIQISAVVLSVIAYIFCDDILQMVLIGPFEKYKGYLTSSFMRGNSVIMVFYPVFCIIVFLIFKQKIQGKSHTLDNLVPMLFVGMVLTILSTKHYIIERMALYITVYNIRLVAMVVHHFYKNRQQWNYHLATICALIISIGAFVFGITSDRYLIVPYKVAQEQLENVPMLKVMNKPDPLGE